MIPPELIERHRSTQAAIVTLANRDLLAVWRTLDLDDAPGSTALLIPAVRDITAAYGDVTAVAAADFYDEARAAAGATGAFRARPGAVAPTDQVDALTRWAVTPIWSRDPRYGDALNRLAGGAGRLIQQAGRDTIEQSTAVDPAGARYVRVPNPNACAFCKMLATNIGKGDTYTSAEAALSVVGIETRERGRVQNGRWTPSRTVGRTGRTRGTRAIGEPYHDNCRCTASPVWSDEDIPDVNRDLKDLWDRAQQEAGAAGELRRGTKNDALNAFRRALTHSS